MQVGRLLNHTHTQSQACMHACIPEHTITRTHMYTNRRYTCRLQHRRRNSRRRMRLSCLDVHLSAWTPVNALTVHHLHNGVHETQVASVEQPPRLQPEGAIGCVHLIRQPARLVYVLTQASHSFQCCCIICALRPGSCRDMQSRMVMYLMQQSCKAHVREDVHSVCQGTQELNILLHRGCDSLPIEIATCEWP